MTARTPDAVSAAPSAPAEGSYPNPRRRLLIMLSVLLATVMVAIDTTIANVALPHMQASLMAGPEEVVWVLTSYIVAAAIGTPLGGWLATRFGRKRVMLISVCGFAVSSMACGIATSLELEVLARLLQGLFGAGLIPLSQATLLDTYPPSLHARAMGYFAVGSMLGPLLGPPLGGLITDAIGWRWVFFINVPFGIAAALGIWFFQKADPPAPKVRFDFFGFASVSIAIGALQIMLDRGQQLDWFQSPEIWIEAGVAALAAWFAGVHMFTRRDTFIKVGLFVDRNFVVGCLLGMLVGVVAFGAFPIFTALLQRQLGYSPLLAGELMTPRGLSCAIAMLIVPKFMGHMSPRLPVALGLVVTAAGLFMHAMLSPATDTQAIMIAGAVQGFGIGLLFVPMSLIAFATLKADLRNEGSAMFNLARNLGMAVGVSVIQRNTLVNQAANHARLAEHVRPDAPAVQWVMPDTDWTSAADLARLNQLVTHQADMFGYINGFAALGVLSILMIGLLVFIRPAKPGSIAPAVLVE